MIYRPDIDGLRALAVVPVILYHAGISQFAGGYIGVDVFFVISGYLITSIILEDIEKNTFSFRKFYERRARRILPALFLVTLVTIPVAYLRLSPGDLYDFGQSVVATVLFGANILFFMESGYYETAAALKPLLHVWSLSIEEQFYVIFPAVLLIVWRFARKYAGVIFIVGFVASLALAEWASLYYPNANFYLLPSRGWELLAGAFLAHYQMRKATQIDAGKGAVLSAIGLTLIVASFFLFDENTRHPGVFTLLPVVGTIMVLAYGAAEGPVRSVLTMKAVVWTGLASYSLYLWHHPILAFARLSNTDLSPGVLAVLAVPLIGLSFLSYSYVETPFRNRARISSRTFLASALIVASLLVAAGLYGHFSGGLPGRLSEPSQELLARMDRLHQEKLANVALGTCHYNDAHVDLDDFIGNWSCQQEGAAVIVGDSHAAGRALALRLNGVAVGQLTGSSCSLVPRTMSHDCRRIFDTGKSALRERLNGAPLVLASRFADGALGRIDMQEMVAYWREVSDRLYLFTNIPEFPRIKYECLSDVRANKDDCLRAMEFDVRKYERIRSQLESSLEGTGIILIDSKKVFCAINADDPCAVVKNDKLLMFDASHLTLFGAEQFGKELVAQYPDLQE